jgi:hypothetical protein
MVHIEPNAELYSQGMKSLTPSRTKEKLFKLSLIYRGSSRQHLDYKKLLYFYGPARGGSLKSVACNKIALING